MRQTALLIAGIALLAGCKNQPTATRSGAELESPAASKEASFGASVNKDLATLRRVTAPFHDFANATGAGWSAKITSCMTDPAGAGGMGFHYGNTALIDGIARVDQPELLLYEPEKNGKLRFVGVEYIVPFTDIPSTADAPTLLGQRFGRVPEFGVWGLHIWVGRHNPNGIFATWNPKVSCANAPASQRAVVTHHHE
jgi:hypothetical protein